MKEISRPTGAGQEVNLEKNVFTGINRFDEKYNLGSGDFFIATNVDISPKHCKSRKGGTIFQNRPLTFGERIASCIITPDELEGNKIVVSAQVGDFSGQQRIILYFLKFNNNSAGNVWKPANIGKYKGADNVEWWPADFIFDYEKGIPGAPICSLIPHKNGVLFTTTDKSWFFEYDSINNELKGRRFGVPKPQFGSSSATFFDSTSSHNYANYLSGRFVYGVELVKAVRDSSGNILHDGFGMPIREYSSGINRYSVNNKISTLKQVSDIAGGWKDPAVSVDSLGGTFRTVGGVSDITFDYPFDFIVFWRSKSLDYEIGEVPEGVEYELYPTSYYSTVDLINEIISGTSYSYIDGGNCICLDCDTIAFEDGNFPADDQNIDRGVVTLQEELELYPIQSAPICEIYNQKIWFCNPYGIDVSGNTAATRFDSTVFYSGLLGDFFGIYDEQYDPQQFVSAGEGDGAKILSLVGYNDSLLVFRNKGIGVIYRADPAAGFGFIDERRSISDYRSISKLNQASIGFVESSMGRFMAITGFQITNYFNGVEISKRSEYWVRGTTGTIKAIDWNGRLLLFRPSNNDCLCFYYDEGGALSRHTYPNLIVTDSIFTESVGSKYTEGLFGILSNGYIYRYLNGFQVEQEGILVEVDRGIDSENYVIQGELLTSYFNISQGRALLDFNKLSAMIASMNDNIQLSIFVDGVLWEYSDDNAYKSTTKYGSEILRNFRFYPSRTLRRPVGNNFSFSIKALAPFDLSSITFDCRAYTDPDMSAYAQISANISEGVGAVTLAEYMDLDEGVGAITLSEYFVAGDGI